VNAKLPIRTLKELIEYGKANPGKLRYGTAGVGGGPHLTTVLLNKAAGIDGVHVPYPGVGPGLAALAGGHIDMGLAAPSSVKPHIDAGNIVAVATTGTGRHPNFPDVPTLREAGVPLDVTIFYGILAPAGTPEPILARLRKEFSAMLKDPKIVERFDKLGYQPDYIEGDAFKDFVVKDLEQWRNAARSANVTVPD
jgi:tripartite-type tricarboxylate transporter receptor subunit TctC